MKYINAMAQVIFLLMIEAIGGFFTMAGMLMFCISNQLARFALYILAR